MLYIQAHKVSELDGRPTIVSATVHDEGLIDIHGDDFDLTMWTHDPADPPAPEVSWIVPSGSPSTTC